MCNYAISKLLSQILQNFIREPAFFVYFSYKYIGRRNQLLKLEKEGLLWYTVFISIIIPEECV